MPLQPALSTACRKVIVIAYREDVRQLVGAATPHFSLQINHAAAWRAIAAGTDELTIVVEADLFRAGALLTCLCHSPFAAGPCLLGSIPPGPSSME